MSTSNVVPREIRHVVTSLSLGQHKLRCPLCQDTRQKHRSDRPLSVKIDNEGVQYYCHHCEQEGGWVNNDNAAQDDWSWGNMPIITPISSESYDERAKQYLIDRGISESVVAKHAITGTYRFQGSTSPAVGFPYRANDKEAIKWRSADSSKQFSQQNVCEDFFLLEHAVLGNELLIVEGEIDALAWLSAGLPDNVSVLSVPNGAPRTVRDGRIDPREDKKFRYVWAARELIENAPKIYLNTDTDEPGQALAEELARRIGRAKSWRTTFDGLKDAAEALAERGSEYMLSRLRNSTPVPLAGLIETDAFVADYVSLYENGQMTGASTGLKNLDALMTVPTGMLSVVTGYPMSGKSDFVDQLCVNLANDHGWKTVYCSFEKPPELHMAQIAEKKTGKPFFQDKGGLSRMTAAERDYAHQWIDEHFMFMDYRKGSPGDIDGILDVASGAVMRMGCRVLVIDPYNYVEQPSGFSGKETDWISKMLTKVGRWAKQHDCHVIFVAHPAKPADRGARVVGGVDISGSMAWFAKADIGITAVRGESDNTNEIHVWKVRWAWMGTPGKCDLIFDKRNSRWSDYDINAIVEDDYEWDW